MKTIGTLFVLLVAISQVTAAPFLFNKFERLLRPTERLPETPFCRLFQGPSRCVDEPLPIEDKEPWCPYRMCAPSYVPAELCPANIELQVTNKCKVEEITRDIYKCDGNHFGHNYVPIGCKPGTLGCIEVPTCSCFKVRGVTSKVLKDIGPFKPDCSKKAP